MIAKINSVGIYQLKVRGEKKSSLQQSMTQARSTVVSVSKTQSTSLESKFKAMSVPRFKEVYGKTPQQAGVETTKKVCDGKLTEIVLIRNLPDGEWDMTIKEESAAQQKELIDNGNMVIRESQQDQIFKSLGKQAMSALSKAVQPSALGNQQPNITQDSTYIIFDMGMNCIYHIGYISKCVVTDLVACFQVFA